MPAVITFGTHFSKYSKDGKVLTADDVEFNDALRRLVAAGADVVGFNCMSGPTSMLPLLESAAKADIGVGNPCLKRKNWFSKLNKKTL